MIDNENKELAAMIKALSFQTRLDLAKSIFSEKHNSKSIIWIEETDEAEAIQVVLFIDGEVNLFPITTSVCDALTIADFIAEFLSIPENRKICGGKLCSLNEVRNIPLTKAEGRIYAKQVIDWLQNDVKPKPKKIRFIS